MRNKLAGALLVGALTLTACSEDPPPVVPPSIAEESLSAVYDDDLEPAAAALALVPDEASILVVTDLAELRLRLEQSDLTSDAQARERNRFWRVAEREAVLLSDGLLRPVDRRLRRQYGFTQDDVLWEARFALPTGEGWALRFRDDVDFSGIEEAVADGVGPLAGAETDRLRRLVLMGAADDPSDSWAADPGRVALVGATTVTTYLDTACIPYEVAFAGSDAADLAAAPAADVDGLDELEAFAVSYGTELATVHLGPVRDDTFVRARLPEVLPSTDPDFGRGYVDPVADPSGGRIGYQLGELDVAERLARERRLPFAVCAT